MRVLHICNDFCGSKVHSNLYRELDKIGVNQTVFTCYRGNYQEGTNKFEASNTNFIYRGVLSTKHRFLFHTKIKKVYQELLNATVPKDYDLIHAVTMFTDGAVAYKLYKAYGIPYVISVRNTDINEFLVVAPHTWSLGLKILKHAQKIVFISKAPKEKFCRHILIKRILPEIQQKIVIQPNGLDNFWLDHIYKGEVNHNHQIIYVGKFDLNKNVIRLIEAVIDLKKEYKDIKLHLVGGDGSRHEKVFALVDSNKDCLEYHGKVYDKDELMRIYRQCSVFAMPSIHETFGLVYVEALSQGLAVVYTKDQGIDGLFDNRVGESVNAFSVQSIRDAIRKLFNDRSQYYINESIDFESFRWEIIAKKYQMIYNQVYEVLSD